MRFSLVLSLLLFAPQSFAQTIVRTCKVFEVCTISQGCLASIEEIELLEIDDHKLMIRSNNQFLETTNILNTTSFYWSSNNTDFVINFITSNGFVLTRIEALGPLRSTLFDAYFETLVQSSSSQTAGNPDQAPALSEWSVDSNTAFQDLNTSFSISLGECE